MSLSTHKLLKINSNETTDKLNIELVLNENNNDLFTLELKTSFQIYISELKKNVIINTSSMIESIDKTTIKINTKKDYTLDDSSVIIDNLLEQINDLKNKLSKNGTIIVDTNKIDVFTNIFTDDDSVDSIDIDNHSISSTEENDAFKIIENQPVAENHHTVEENHSFKIDDNSSVDSIKNDHHLIQEKLKKKENLTEINDILNDTSKISFELDEIVKNLKKNVKNDPLIKSVTNNSIDIKTIENINDTNEKEKQLLYHLKFLLSIGNVSLSGNMIYIITEMMKFVEKFSLNGEEKKELILSTLKKYIYNVEDFHLTEQDYILTTICPELIDILISVDSRKIKIRKQFKCFQWK